MKWITVPLALSFSISLCFSQSDTSTKDFGNPFVLGAIDEIQSALLSENRILNIYLPEGYNQNDTTKYAVIYLLDGSADEDFIHVAGLVQFNTFPWIARIPNSIVVGIANTDRKRDFTFPTSVTADKEKYPSTGHSLNFINFIEKELQPYIESKYKANASRTIIGQSLGGLLATEILIKRPALFDHYIIISPSLWWDHGSLLNQTGEIFEESFAHPTAIYIGVGKEGPTPSEPPRIMEDDANALAGNLQSSKSKNVHVYFDYLPGEDHATIAHQAIYNAFRVIYSNMGVK